MRLLIADLARRNRWRALSFGGTLVGMWWMSAQLGSAAMAVGMSMGTAFGVGSQLSLRYVPLAIWYLPVSKRDVWRGGWLVATAGATLLTTIAALLAMLAPSVRESFSLATVLLSSVYTFAYTGVGCWLIILARRPDPARGPWRLVWPAIKGLAEIALHFGMPAALFLGGMFGGSRILPKLPTQWGELTPSGLATLVAALGLTAATYFHAPRPAARAIPSPRLPGKTPRTSRIDVAGLSGLPRLLVHESAWTLLVGGPLVAGSVLVVLVAANLFHSSQTVIGFLRTASLLIFDDRVTPAPAGGLDAFTLLIWYGFYIASLAARFPAMIRHLRVLPLGAAQVNALLIAWPVMIWSAVWLLLLTLHYLLVGRSAASLHADVLVALIGLSSVTGAMTLRLTGLMKVIAFSAAVAVVPFLQFVKGVPAGALVVFGAGSLAAAAALNRAALGHSSTYRVTAFGFGVAPDLTPR